MPTSPVDSLRRLLRCGHFQDLVPDGLSEFVEHEVRSTWVETPAWQWTMPDFPTMRDRVQWKLAQPITTPSYLRAIIDEELFTMAIASEYRAYERARASDAGLSSLISEILRTAKDVMRRETVADAGGWLFQPGVWRDHGDYAFAGHLNSGRNLKPAPLSDVAEDSSHAGRWPLWLRSLRDAYSSSQPEYRFYEVLLDGLGEQFADRVLVPPSHEQPYVVMNNYMDGRNGLYRWGYDTAGHNSGYEKFGLSGSFFIVWWALLPDPGIHAAACDAAAGFPLPAKALRLYVGPNTTRERNPLVTLPAYYKNGFAELNMRLACSLGSE